MNTGVLQVVVGSLCFGLIGLFGKAAYAAGWSMGPMLSTRFLLAALFLGPALFIFRRQDLRLTRRQIFTSLALGVAGYAVFGSLYFTAIRGLSISLAALLLYTFPFWTILINRAMGERLSVRAIGGLFFSFAGLVTLLWGQFEIHNPWDLLSGLGAALTYALYIVVSSRALKDVPALGSGFFIILGAGLTLFVFHRPDHLWADFRGWEGWWPIVALAIAGTIVPMTLIQAGLRRLPSSRVVVLCLVEPVTASVASVLFLGEQPSWRQLVGGLMVLAGIVAVSRPTKS